MFLYNVFLTLFMIMLCAYLLFFFFSSRRRHTRCSRDWSSDVCSSDLLARLEHVYSLAAELDARPGVPPIADRARRPANIRARDARALRATRSHAQARGDRKSVV